MLKRVLQILLLILLLSCVRNTKEENVKEEVITEKKFQSIGVGKDFFSARDNAYGELVKNAIIFIIGKNNYEKNKKDIDNEFIPYIKARKYIFGEGIQATKDKEKKWISQSRDADGNLKLELEAWVSIEKLRSDLSKYVNTSTLAKESNIKSDSFDSSKKEEKTESSTIPDADLSALTFLVYYDKKKLSKEEAIYSAWAIEMINKELSSLNITTFDVETMEKLVEERSLMHEAQAGSIGVGLLLAQKVFAELYAEVTPTVNYQGNRAHVMLNVKVFVRTTGALIANIEKGGQQYESVSRDASIKLSMREAVKKVFEELNFNLKKYVSNGRYYFVRLTGVSNYKNASKFTSAVSKINGVVKAELKSGSREEMVYDYNIQFKGNPTALVDKIFAMVEEVEGFEKFDLVSIRGNEIQFTLE